MMSLADAILDVDITSVSQLLNYGIDVNQLDEYGFTPLIEAAIVDSMPIIELLISHGADVNLPDINGGTVLQWAVENNNLALCELLLNQGADPNAYNLSGQPVLTMPSLRRQHALRKLLISRGADQVFTSDFINVKLLGHLFELIGTASILDPENHYVEVDFEGFYLEVTLGLIASSLDQFRNHFSARQLRRFSSLSGFIVSVLDRASTLIQYQQYRVNLKEHQHEIASIIQEEPLIIPVAYEGHAITFIRFEEFWVKCDRREDSRLYDNIMIYEITKNENLTPLLIQRLIYEKQSDDFINRQLDQLLGLKPFTELKVSAQISGNCSWANVEAVIPALFFLALLKLNQEAHSIAYYKTLALNYFSDWREWNKNRSLNFCIQSFKEAGQIRKACKAEILAAILYQNFDAQTLKDQRRMDTILEVFTGSSYTYILENYVRVYYYENHTDRGKRFADFLKEHELLK